MRVDTVLISTQHAPEVSQAEITETVTEQIIIPALPEGMVDKNLKVFVNPTGRFVVGLYMFNGLLMGVVATLATARLGSGTPSIGLSFDSAH